MRISPHFNTRTVWNRILSHLRNKLFLVKNSDGDLMAARLSFYDDVVALFGRIEEQTAETLFLHECIRGSAILDVGAHIGRYVLMAASRVGISGKVIACEPHPVNFSILLKNLRMNGYENVIPRNVALSAEDGFVSLSVGDDSGLHSIVDDKQSIALKKLRVRSTTIDSLLKELGMERIDMCKIDVEGAELLVLKGAEYSLRKKKIRRFVCEVHRGVHVEEVEEFFRRNGFITRTFRNFVYSYCPTHACSHVSEDSLEESRKHL